MGKQFLLRALLMLVQFKTANHMVKVLQRGLVGQINYEIKS
jgi:hypothetical protein